MGQQENYISQQENYIAQQENYIAQQENYQHNSKIHLSKSQLIGIIAGVIIVVIIIILALCYAFNVIKFNSGIIPPTTPTTTSTTASTPTPTPTTYPWAGGEIISFWYWEGNYAALPYNTTTKDTYQTITNQAWYTGVTAAQTYGSSVNNLTATTTGSFTYYGTPDGTSFNFPLGLNSIIIFIGLTNATLSLGLTYAYNYTVNNWPVTMVTQVYDYFGYTNIQQATDANTLIAISFGGGNSSTGAWTTGVPTATFSDTTNVGVGGIYSIYQQCTAVGQTFSYTEYGTGTPVPQTGTGLCYGYTSLTDGPLGNGMYNATDPTSSVSNTDGYDLYSITQFNCLVFDVEAGAGAYPGYSTSSAEDFINLFAYIKGTSSAFAYYNLPPPLIIVTIAHSCSQNIGVGVIGPLLSPSGPCYYDYISPQLYTCNLGTTNEYAANDSVPWSPDWGGTASGITSFTEYLSQNDKFQTYGLNMIIPSINNSSLYTTAGSNPYPYYPNLYWYEADYTATNQYVPPGSYTTSSGETVQYTAPTTVSAGAGVIGYSVDKGAVDFFTTMFQSEQSHLGGYIEWLNGTCSS